MNAEEDLKFGEDGLLPAVAQDCRDGAVLMLAYVNREALGKMIETSEAHYWSRSRKKLWRKGETSGNTQRLKRIKYDCDADALLLEVEQSGPACHTGQRTCFFREIEIGGRPGGATSDREPDCKGAARMGDILERIYEVVLDRKINKKEGSYVCSLLGAGQGKILKKIGEEASEVVIASKNGDKIEIIREAADLWFHTLVLLGLHEIAPGEVGEELEKRFGKRHLKENRSG